MGLPFLKKDKEASVSAEVDTVKRKPDEQSEVEPKHVAAQDMLSAIKSGDEKALSDALEAFFQIVDSEPHMEGPHEGE